MPTCTQQLLWEGPSEIASTQDRMKSVSLTVPEIEVRTKEDKVMVI